MAITTWGEIQTILDLPAGLQTRVEAMIPHIEDDYVRIRNRAFDTGDTLTITDLAAADGELTVSIGTANFMVSVEAGDSEALVARKIHFALAQSGRYRVSLDGAAVTIISRLDMIALDPAGTGVTATTTGIQTVYPDGAEMTAIRMLQFQLNAGKGAGISSESLGDHSVTYDTGLGAWVRDYPKSVVGGIKRHVSFYAH